MIDMIRYDMIPEDITKCAVILENVIRYDAT